MEDTPKGEATILSLSVEMGELLCTFQNVLDKRFEMSVKEEEKSPERPSSPNVLDEILEQLQMNKAHLARIISFVSSDVLPKIN